MKTSRKENNRIELHRHLDASVRLSTLLELAQKKGLEGQSTGLDAFGAKFLLREPMKDLGAVLSKFDLFPRVFDRPETLERVAFEACEDVWNEGTQSVEFRFSPEFVCTHSKLKWADVLDAFDLLERERRAPYEYFNVGTTDHITVREIADIVVRELGLSNVTYEFTGGPRGWKGDVPVYRLDTSKIRSRGWASKYSSEGAVTDAVRSMIGETA